MVNDEARAYWTDEAGPRWARHRRHHDEVLAPFHGLLLAAAAVREGDYVLDLGCGAGTTTLAAADAAGPTGHVVGVDFSPVLLAELERRIALRAGSARTAPIDCLLADMQVDPLPGPADVAISRFGVMFFADPPAAWRNIAAATRPGGRLAFVCWQEAERNPWVVVPTLAAHAVAPPEGPLLPPDAPGPFALADADRVKGLLAGAGWVDIHLASVETPIRLGADLGEAVDHVLRLGAVARAVEAGGETLVVPAVRAAIEPYTQRSGEVRMDAAAWVVTAHRPS